MLLHRAGRDFNLELRMVVVVVVVVKRARDGCRRGLYMPRTQRALHFAFKRKLGRRIARYARTPAFHVPFKGE